MHQAWTAYTGMFLHGPASLAPQRRASSCRSPLVQRLKNRLQMLAVAGGEEIRFANPKAIMSKDPLGYREWAAIVFSYAIDVAAQNPISPSSGTEKRKAIDE